MDQAVKARTADPSCLGLLPLNVEPVIGYSTAIFRKRSPYLHGIFAVFRAETWNASEATRKNVPSMEQSQESLQSHCYSMRIPQETASALLCRVRRTMYPMGSLMPKIHAMWSIRPSKRHDAEYRRCQHLKEKETLIQQLAAPTSLCITPF